MTIQTHHALFRDDAPLQPIVEAARGIGLSISSRTAVRWAVRGRQGLRLPSIKAGGRRMTTVPALCRWLIATEEAAELATATSSAALAPASIHTDASSSLSVTRSARDSHSR